MRSAALERMRARARDVRTRALVRSWNARQRNHAAGTWYRLRRALADAKKAYAIDDDDARQLVAEGHLPLGCGAAVVPEKTIVFVSETRLSHLATRREIPVSLGPEFLSARAIALIPFENLSNR